MFDPPPKPEEIKIVWPTEQEMSEGMATVRKCLPFWRGNPAYLLIKPNLGLIVSLQNFEFDTRYFALTFSVDDVIIEPAGFDRREPMRLEFVWNQPYMWISAEEISAPYHCGLHFGAQGVQNIRKLRATRFFEQLKNTPLLLGFLRGCFDAGFRLPHEKPVRPRPRES